MKIGNSPAGLCTCAKSVRMRKFSQRIQPFAKANFKWAGFRNSEAE